jgi:adenylate cyclase class 2
MAYEIEVKAWIDDPGALKRHLADIATSVRDYVKEDVYLRAPSGQDYRIRHDGGQSICTFKEKTIRDGVEVSREVEFTVSDADAFEELALRCSSTVFARKRKTGSVYTLPEANVEVSHVDGLGDFVEIERMVEKNDDGEHDRAQQIVRRILATLGVDEGRIEPRPYTTLLADRGRGAQ